MLEKARARLRAVFFKVFGRFVKQPEFVVEAYILVYTQEEADEIKQAIEDMVYAKYDALSYISAMSQKDSDAIDAAIDDEDSLSFVYAPSIVKFQVSEARDSSTSLNNLYIGKRPNQSVLIMFPPGCMGVCNICPANP